MTDHTRLALIRILHTIVWVFFNIVILYLLYAVVIGSIDRWVWICLWLDSCGRCRAFALQKYLSCHANSEKIF